MKTSSDCRNLVDDELLDLLETLPTVTISAGNLAEWRATEPVAWPVDWGTAAASVRVSNQRIGGEGGANVTLCLYQPPPSAVPLACILHIHGGGFVAGRPAEGEALHRQMAADLGCVIASIDYRLAPETKFPGNIEDCYAGLNWVFSHANEINVDPQAIGVMGESAGGGLAAALALLARDRGEFSLAFQHLLCPMLDDRTCVAIEPHPFAGKWVWTQQNNHFGWSALLGREPGSADVSPYASPARAVSLTGLPPTFISTGALDLFIEENIEYARRLIRAGVPVELRVYPGAFHGFQLHPTATVARSARVDSLAALTRFLRPKMSERAIG